MKRLIQMGSLVLVVIWVVGCAQNDPKGRETAVLPESDQSAIRDIVRRYVDAREAQNPQAIETLFTEDADQLVSDGTWRHGRDELVRGMLESSRRTGGRRTIEVQTIRMVSFGVALADGPYRQTGLTSGTSRELWTMLLMKKTSDGWKISAIRNMLPAAPAATRPVQK